MKSSVLQFAVEATSRYIPRHDTSECLRRTWSGKQNQEVSSNQVKISFLCGWTCVFSYGDILALLPWVQNWCTFAGWRSAMGRFWLTQLLWCQQLDGTIKVWVSWSLGGIASESQRTLWMCVVYAYKVTYCLVVFLNSISLMTVG